MSVDAYLATIAEDEHKYACMVLAQRAGERKSLAPPKQFGIDAPTAKAIREQLDFLAAQSAEVPDLPPIGVLTQDPKPRPERYSVSSLRWAENCLWGMKLSREFDDTGAPAIAGNLFHEVADRLATTAYLDGRARYEPEVACAIAEDIMGDPVDKLPISLGQYVDVLEWVSKWANMATFNSESIWLVEAMYVHELNGIRHSARLDRVEVTDDLVIVRDCKTGQKMPTQAEFEEGIQTPAYGWHLLQEFPKAEWFDLGEEWVRWGVLRNVVLHRDDLKIEKYLDVAAKRIDAFYDALDKGEEPRPTPGSHCGNCSMPLKCPKQALSMIVPGQPQFVGDLVGWLAITDAQRKAVMKRLAAEVEQQGEPFFVGDLKAGFVHVHKEESDKDLIKAFIAEHGGDAADFYAAQDYNQFKVAKAGGEEG